MAHHARPSCERSSTSYLRLDRDFVLANLLSTCADRVRT